MSQLKWHAIILCNPSPLCKPTAWLCVWWCYSFKISMHFRCGDVSYDEKDYANEVCIFKEGEWFKPSLFVLSCPVLSCPVLSCPVLLSPPTLVFSFSYIHLFYVHILFPVNIFAARSVYRINQLNSTRLPSYSSLTSPLFSFPLFFSFSLLSSLLWSSLLLSSLLFSFPLFFSPLLSSSSLHSFPLLLFSRFSFKTKLNCVLFTFHDH